MKKEISIVLVLLLLLAGVLAMLGLQGLNEMPVDAVGEVKFTEIKKSIGSAVDDKRALVIMDSGEWAELWNEMFPTEMITPIELEDTMLIAVFQGAKPTGGYTIEINKIIENDKIKVFVTEFSPGENCVVTLALTSPYHIVEMKDSDKEVEFIFEEKEIDC